MTTKSFPLRVLLTVTTGRLLTVPKGPRDNGIGDLYELLNWMTDDSLMTHQLPRAAEQCKPWLLKWFPELGPFEGLLVLLDDYLAANKAAAVEKWLAEMKAQFPDVKDSYDVPRLPTDLASEGHVRRDPLEELAEMIGPEKIIVVQA